MTSLFDARLTELRALLQTAREVVSDLERIGAGGGFARPSSSVAPDGPVVPCTCTIACIPQGITEEQTCRLRFEADQ